jgi:hypothetical protein
MNTLTHTLSYTHWRLQKVITLWAAALLVAFSLFSQPAFSQDEIIINGQPCGLHGNAKQSDAYALNAYKNRYTAPGTTDFDTAITLDALIKSGDPNQFSQDKAAVLRGYVYDIKMGGVETCNCKTKDPQFRDTHIELVPDEAHTDAQYRVIAEVTPRLRALMQKRGEDWSTAALRRSIKGQWVELAGWLTYDVEHETAAYANDPDDAIGQHNWRATAWEVHPITYLKIIDKGSESSLTSIVQTQAGTKRAAETDKTTKAEAKGPSPLLIIIGILVVLVAGYFLLKKLLG